MDNIETVFGPVADGTPAWDSAQLMLHYTQWLQANAGALEKYTAEECVRTYMRKQWGEDTEDKWGHAFDAT